MTAVPDWTQEPGAQEAFAAAGARRAFDPEALAESVRAAGWVASDLDQAVMGLDDLPWTDSAAMLDDLRKARETLQRIEGRLEVHTAKAMAAADVKATPLDGVGFVEWRRGRDRKAWDHERLAQDVLDAHLSENETGEAPSPWEVRDWILAAGHVDYWRTKALAALGLEVDDYCESTPGRLSVQITRPG